MYALLHAVPPTSLAERVRDFLGRQNAWFAKVLDELKGIEAGESDAALASFIERHSSIADERTRYEQELGELAAEWREVSATFPNETRAEIRAMARRGETLTEEIRAEYERAIGIVGTDTERVKGALQTLRQGRDLLRRYAPGTIDDALFIDRKA